MTAHNQPLGSVLLDRKRGRTNNTSMQVRLPTEAKDVLSQYAKLKGVTASTVARWAIAEYMDRHGLEAAPKAAKK